MEQSLKVRIVGKTVRKGMFFLRPLKNAYKKYMAVSARRTYHSWAVHNELECFVDDESKTQPLVSIVVPAYNTFQEHLTALVYSICNQHYQNWELILVNASNDADRKQAIIDCLQIDTRIKVIDLPENPGIAANTNAGIEIAKGDYIVFADHDDLLHPCALHCLIGTMVDRDADLGYSDEDKITHDGKHYFGPHCKPDWSPHLLENLNYINHLTAIKTEHVQKVKGLRPECDGAQDYDLLLRVIDECDPTIVHVPRVLYHWRAAATSTAQDISNKTYIFKAGQKALQDHLDRKHIPAQAKILENKPGFYKVKYELTENITVLLGYVEPMKRPASISWLKQLIASQSLTNIIIGDWAKPLVGELSNVHFVFINGSKKNYLQKVAEAIKTDYFIYFQEAWTPLEKDALAELLAVCKHSGVFAVQPVAVGIDNTIIDSGYVDAWHGLQLLFKGLKLPENTFFGDTDWVRDIRASSCKVAAFKTEDFKGIVQNKDRIRPADLPPNKSVVWPFVTCIYESYLRNDIGLATFNPQLTQSMFEIYMNSSTWDVEKDREHV